MPPPLSVASTKPGAALVRSQGWTPWQGRRWSLAPRDRGRETGKYCLMGHLDHVDRHVDHDPHYVDEVPIDPRNLDAEVVVRLRAEMPTDGADQRVEEQIQPDEDVHPVEAGEARSEEHTSELQSRQ